jgi:hypothetical protein
MILLSFDVGIKNLAYCLLSIDPSEKNSKHFIEIIKWNIIDLSCDQLELEAKTSFAGRRKKILQKACRRNATSNASKTFKVKF